MRLVTDHAIADPSAQSTPTVSLEIVPPAKVAGTIFALRGVMANRAKRPVRKADPAKVSRKMREAAVAGRPCDRPAL